MRGVYRFIEEGKVVEESENSITTTGKLLVARYLAGLISSYAGAIVVGVDSTAATVNDVRLGYETARAPISVRNVTGPSADIFQISFKAALPSEMDGYLKEAGLISQVFNRYSGSYGDRLLSRFISGEGWEVTSSNNMSSTYESNLFDYASGNVVRIGGEGLRITSTSASSPSITLSNTSVTGDFGGYSSLDKFSVAYSASNIPAFTQIQLRFYSDSVSYYYTNIAVPQKSAGAWTYGILNATKSQFLASGSPNWGGIVRCVMVVTTSATGADMVIDGLSLFDTDYINPDYSVISRSIPSNPVLKTSGKSMDIEYFLEFKL